LSVALDKWVNKWGSLHVVAAALLLAAAMPRLVHSAQPTDANPLQLSPDHATLSVADLDKEAEWLQRVLGFRETNTFKNGADFAVRQMAIPGYRIDLVWQRGSSRQHLAKGRFEQGWLHVVFRTPDIDASYQRLLAAGTDVMTTKNESRQVSRLTFHDPEGNELEIVRE
jgi:catechol 2,3-dioxygenase-like lactoylglutathione lyase family enzyme